MSSSDKEIAETFVRTFYEELKKQNPDNLIKFYNPEALLIRPFEKDTLPVKPEKIFPGPHTNIIYVVNGFSQSSYKEDIIISVYGEARSTKKNNIYYTFEQFFILRQIGTYVIVSDHLILHHFRELKALIQKLIPESQTTQSKTIDNIEKHMTIYLKEEIDQCLKIFFFCIKR